MFSIFETENSEIPIAKFGQAYKEYKEVMQHWKTIFISKVHTGRFLSFRYSPKGLTFFSQIDIKELHFSLTEDLLDSAEKYRNFADMQVLKPDLTFPNNKLLDKVMEEFYNRANSLIEKGLTDPNADKFMIAAQITYEFVRIHPFENFNGRVSRILLSMVMYVFGLGFSVIIRGNKKSKDRYMWALKYANAIKDPENFDTRHLEPYATLIAMAVCEGFEQINSNLKLAGIPTIE